MGEEFLWGATTSAHQVEGNNIHNDWWSWEHRTSGRQASGAAADHWNRWREDLVMAKNLGLTAYRFSIEWSRIEPQEGHFNRQAIEHYRQVAAEVRRLGMESFVTLFDVTLPAWVAEKGGWRSSESPALFERYVQFVAQHLGEAVRFWVPINDPLTYVMAAYMRGIWLPQQHSIWQAWSVMRRLMQAHRLAYRVLHRFNRGSHVGVTSRVFTEGLPGLFFLYLMRGLGRQTDFIGLNYVDRPAKEMSSALGVMQRYNLPLYVTEAGVDSRGSVPADFIRDSLRAVERVQQAGADIRGYFYKSLLDEFEWERGYEPGYGLIEVDFSSQERTIRSGAYIYKAIVETALHGNR